MEQLNLYCFKGEEYFVSKIVEQIVLSFDKYTISKGNITTNDFKQYQKICTFIINVNNIN